MLEASGAVVVLFALSWRLGPVLAGELDWQTADALSA